MNHLTRSEEYILLAVWKLQDEAYTLPIQERLSEISGRPWSLSSVYAPLERLVKRNMIDSSLSEARAERGGRPKRIYKLTDDGRQALLEIQRVGQTMWEGISAAALQRGGAKRLVLTQIEDGLYTDSAGRRFQVTEAPEWSEDSVQE